MCIVYVHMCIRSEVYHKAEKLTIHKHVWRYIKSELLFSYSGDTSNYEESR